MADPTWNYIKLHPVLRILWAAILGAMIVKLIAS